MQTSPAVGLRIAVRASPLASIRRFARAGVSAGRPPASGNAHRQDAICDHGRPRQSGPAGVAGCASMGTEALHGKTMSGGSLPCRDLSQLAEIPRKHPQGRSRQDRESTSTRSRTRLTRPAVPRTAPPGDGDTMRRGADGSRAPAGPDPSACHCLPCRSPQKDFCGPLRRTLRQAETILQTAALRPLGERAPSDPPGPQSPPQRPRSISNPDRALSRNIRPIRRGAARSGSRRQLRGLDREDQVGRRATHGRQGYV